MPSASKKVAFAVEPVVDIITIVRPAAAAPCAGTGGAGRSPSAGSMVALMVIGACGSRGGGHQVKDEVASAALALSTPAPATHSDLRRPTRDQVLTGTARAAVACMKQKPVRLGELLTDALEFAVNAPTLPEAMASQLACGFDRLSGATCDAIAACTNVAVPGKSDFPTCDGDDIVGISRDGARTGRIQCRDFGEHCVNTALGAICSVGVCTPGETYVCDQGVAEACVQGYRTRTLCGTGRTCGVRVDGMLDCIGTGAACTAPRCEGNVAVNCVTTQSTTAGREARVDCGAQKLACSLSPSAMQAVCVPPPLGCNPEIVPAFCVLNNINVCVAGSWWSSPCAALGAKGICSPIGGASGEATCL